MELSRTLELDRLRREKERELQELKDSYDLKLVTQLSDKVKNIHIENQKVCVKRYDYCSIRLLLYSISSGALESPDILLSHSVILLALHNTIILIITLTSVITFISR